MRTTEITFAGSKFEVAMAAFDGGEVCPVYRHIHDADWNFMSGDYLPTLTPAFVYDVTQAANTVEPTSQDDLCDL